MLYRNGLPPYVSANCELKTTHHARLKPGAPVPSRAERSHNPSYASNRQTHLHNVKHQSESPLPEIVAPQEPASRAELVFSVDVHEHGIQQKPKREGESKSDKKNRSHAGNELCTTGMERRPMMYLIDISVHFTYRAYSLRAFEPGTGRALHE